MRICAQRETQFFDLPNVKPPILSSAIYETEPVGCEPGARKFLNAVVEFEYEGDPARLLEQLIQIEEALGRKRDHPQSVSRTIDIDLLYCGDQRINDERLQLPHPRLHLRELCPSTLSRYPAGFGFVGTKENYSGIAC